MHMLDERQTRQTILSPPTLQIMYRTCIRRQMQRATSNVVGLPICDSVHVLGEKVNVLVDLKALCAQLGRRRSARETGPLSGSVKSSSLSVLRRWGT